MNREAPTSAKPGRGVVTGTGTILDYLAFGPAETSSPGERVAPPGIKAEHEVGVLYQGPWDVFGDGFAEHTRRAARALAATGLPVHLRSLTQDSLSAGSAEMVDTEKLLRPLTTASIGRYEAEIHQVVPFDTLVQFLTTHQRLSFGELRVVNAHRVLYNVWERDRISNAARSALARVGQIWVACPANAEMLGENGVDLGKVRVVPCPFFPDDPLLQLRGRPRRGGPPRFLHIGKWEPRKAQDRMLGAFLRAFRPGEAQLFIKTSSLADRAPVGDFPRNPAIAYDQWMQDEQVAKNGWKPYHMLVQQTREIFVIRERLSAEQMVKLHEIADVYVSLSRGEGFDMPAMDAKLAGNLMVYTPSGGTQALAGPDDIMVQPSGKIPCHRLYGWNVDAQYLDYEIEEAVARLREAAARVASSRQAAPLDMSTFAAVNVGARMRQYLEELKEAAKPVSAAFYASLKEEEAAPAATGPAVELPKPRVALVTHGAALGSAYGGQRVLALLASLLRRHPLLGPIDELSHDVIPDIRPDAVFVEVPTGAPYLRRVGAKKIVLVRMADEGYGACAFELVEGRADLTVLIPTEAAYGSLGSRMPHHVVFNAFEPPADVAVGGRRGHRILYTGAFRFAKDTPLAAEVAVLCPEQRFVWRKSTPEHQPLASLLVPPNVELCDPTSDPDRLWEDIGAVLVTSRSESFCLVAYEAFCRGLPVIAHSDLRAIGEWAGMPHGLYLGDSALVLAAACRGAIRAGADPEEFNGLREVAMTAHRSSLMQLDVFIRTFVLGGG